MTQKAQRRSVKNVHLTERYHWPYVGGWLAFNIVLLILIEVCVLTTLSNLAPSGIAADKLATGSLAGSVILAGLMVFVGVTWAHRLAGVHLRTESTFLQVADGDRSIRLRYRESDQLEDVEAAFDIMMYSFDREPIPQSEGTNEDSEFEREHRTWKNMLMTSQYHFAYMALWVVLSIGQLFLLFFAGVFTLQTTDYVPFDVGNATTIMLGATLLLGFFVLWKSLRSAHRLAGVHIRLRSVFNRVAEGERGLELKFRAYDRLERVEEAFAKMMATLNQGTEVSLNHE